MVNLNCKNNYFWENKKTNQGKFTLHSPFSTLHSPFSTLHSPFSILLLLLLSLNAYSQENDYYFFDKKDIENIRTSSQTTWGKGIIDNLEKTIAERRQHALSVPLLEGGHLHDYFCPVHNVMFTFNWENPDAHYCEFCQKDWKNNKRFDWAWINRVHAENLKYLTASMYLYMANQDTTYAGYIRDMLLDYAGKYPTYMEHNTNRVVNGSWGGKMFGQSLDESVWASDAARAYSVVKHILTSREIQTIEKGYFQPCVNMLLNRKGAGNWQVWHNSGLIALGVALQNDSIIKVALNDPKCGYHFLMKNNVYDDGWWSEGSPIYHYYPLRAMLLSADALRCRNIHLFDKKLYNMFASPASGVYANLYFPAHNDGWYGESLIGQVSLYEIASQRFQDDFLKNVLMECYQKIPRTSPEALQNGSNLVDSKTKIFSESTYFKDMGFAVLRSNDKTVVLKYGPYGGGHGHPDKLSISVHNGKEELFSDLGTSAYGVPDYMQWYRKTVAHNTVTVDGKDQAPVTGTLLNFKAWNNGGEVEARVDGAYAGIEMNRKISLKDNQLSDFFYCSSQDTHTYDYVLILTQKPEFLQKGTPFTLENSVGYNRISNTEKRDAQKSISFQTEGTKIQIQSLENKYFEVITGEAPGIPPKNPQIAEKKEIKPCYPVIIRMKGQNMKLKMECKIN